jgi:diguanylate cyclase (GGDEF)-like protein/putative nucleotidyltransferase with HDIG domain
MMASLPRKAQIYLWITLLLGAAATIWAIASPARTSSNPGIGLFCLLLLAIFAGSRKVEIIRGLKQEEAGTMSLGFIIYFGTLLLYGPSGGLVAALISCLSSCLFPKRQPYYQLFFNLALTVLEAWFSGLAFFLMNGRSLEIDPYRSIPAAAITTVTYFMINTIGIATIIGFCSGAGLFGLWKSKFLWTAPGYFAGAAVSTLAVVFFHGQLTIYLLVGAPIAYLTYQSYAVQRVRADEKQQYIEELQTNQDHLSDLYLATVKSLALAIDAKDKFTHQHILRVQRYALVIAEHMKLTGAELEAVRTGALLHDIGKLGVPEYILLKPGRLTDEEYTKIKKHPEIGAAILDPVDFPWPVVSAVKYHHERWDGTGYPEGLKGDQIPLIARILAVADVYDALTSVRPYREAWKHAAAIEWIKEQSGIGFDPMVVTAFLEIIDDLALQKEASDVMASREPGPLAMQSPVLQETISKADQAAHAIQRASSELWTLYEVARGASSCFGLEDTLHILGDKIQAILPGTACLLLLAENDCNILRVNLAQGMNHEYFEESYTANGHSRSMQVAQTRKSYIGAYDPEDLVLKSPLDNGWIPLNSSLIVSMIHQDKVLGTINLYHPEPDAFTPDFCQLLETIAEPAARALYNGHLFDRTRGHAITDPLTGLYNVRYVTQYVEQRCMQKDRENTGGGRHLTSETSLSGVSTHDANSVDSARKTDSFVLLCLDLDRFKPINDNFGHQKGDQVLRELSALFKTMIRNEDIVARYGGDEFLMIMEDTSAAEAGALAERIQKAVEQYDPGLTHPQLGALRLGVSIGYACYPGDSDDYTSLFAIADTRMYSNKTERNLRRLAPSPPSAFYFPESMEAATSGIVPDYDPNFIVVQALPAKANPATQHVDEKHCA